MYYYIIECLENGWLLIGASTDNLIYGVVWNVQLLLHVYIQKDAGIFEAMYLVNHNSILITSELYLLPKFTVFLINFF